MYIPLIFTYRSLQRWIVKNQTSRWTIYGYKEGKNHRKMNKASHPHPDTMYREGTKDSEKLSAIRIAKIGQSGGKADQLWCRGVKIPSIAPSSR